MISKSGRFHTIVKVVLLLYLLFLVITVWVTVKFDAIASWGLATAYATAFWNEVNVGAIIAGLWTAVVFGAFVGIATFVLSIRDPSDDRFEHRMRYLFNGSVGAGRWFEYVRRESHRMAAYNTSGTREFVIQEFNEGIGAFRLWIQTSIMIRNALADLDYDVSDAIVASVEPDDVGIDVLGGIELLEATNIHGKRVSYLDSPVAIRRGNSPFRRLFPIGIPADGESEYRINCWAWAKQGIPWIDSFNRYTEGLNLKVRNATASSVVDVDAHLVSGDSGQKEKAVRVRIPAGELRDISNALALTPRCRYVLHFRLAPQIP